MSNTQAKKTSKSSQSAYSNPFANALSGMEQLSDSSGAQSGAPFLPNSEHFDSFGSGVQDDWMEQQRIEQEKQRNREILRRKLHDKVNPTSSESIFDAREKQVKKEIDQLRYELRMLAKDVADFEKDVELTLMTEVVKPGQSGTYYINFFQKLRAFIILLRQKIKSARTWANQMSAKKSKKKGKRGSAGIQVGGSKSEQTQAVFDQMHHERSNAMGG